MDTLLEKLRAAAPQTRDTRDRRRRARLNDRYQKRVASGQKMPEIPGVADPTDGGSGSSRLTPPPDSAGLSVEGPNDDGKKEGEGATSEGEDIADRAASLLQGLRGDEGEPVVRDESLRVRRRRESADDERARRRRRRAAQGSSRDENAPQSPMQSPIPEEGPEGGVFSKKEGDRKREAAEDEELTSGLPSPPVTVIVPPSPTTSERGGFSTPPE